MAITDASSVSLRKSCIHFTLLAFRKKLCHDLSECARNLSSNDTNSTKLPVHPVGFKRK